jgi:hypothetical protein
MGYLRIPFATETVLVAVRADINAVIQRCDKKTCISSCRQQREADLAEVLLLITMGA